MKENKKEVMSRLARRNRKDIIFKNGGSLLDAFDDAMKQMWRINDQEYDYICTESSDEELNIILSEKFNFSQAKKALVIVDNKIKECKKNTE